MTEKGLKYLSDIRESIEWIENFTSSIRTYSDYIADKKTQSAVERQLSIIGEAVNKFDVIHPEISLKYAGKIIGFRNRLIHAYDAIDSSIVWAILQNHIKPLKAEIDKIISREKD